VSARKRQVRASTEQQYKSKSARRKVDAVEHLETYIRRASFRTGRWWYGPRTNRLACRACRLSKTELADAVAELVLEGRGYFGDNGYFSFLKLVDWAEEMEDYGPGRSLAGQMWVFSKLGGYLICPAGGEFVWVFPDLHLVFVAKHPWMKGKWMLVEDVNWDDLHPYWGEDC
jgi:hypothetical protein